jgi:cystinosin
METSEKAPLQGSGEGGSGFEVPELSGNAFASAPPGAVVCGFKLSKNVLLIGGSALIVVIAVILGMTLTPPSVDPSPWDRISAIIGWTYFNAWAISFVPQIYLNYTRKCVVGQSFEYVALNVLGFTCYSIYTVAFYWVKPVQDDYYDRYHNTNNVDPNDVGFALYALLMVLINSWQIYSYERGGQRVALWAWAFIAFCVVVMLLWLILLLAGVRTAVIFNVLDFFYGISMVKLAVSIIKYIPQLYLTYKRKLTIGWNIWNVLLDFTGGTLSVTQQLIDCGTTGRWNGIAGNPIKFFLGTFSIFYDIIMMIQHYCLYAKNNRIVEEREAARRRELMGEAASLQTAV